MTLVELGLDAQLGLVLLGVAAAVVRPRRLRPLLTGTASALLGLAGVITGVAALTGRHGVVELPSALPIGPVTLDPTPLGGFFMVVAGAVGAVAAVFAIGYAHGPAASRTCAVIGSPPAGVVRIVLDARLSSVRNDSTCGRSDFAPYFATTRSDIARTWDSVNGRPPFPFDSA